MDTLGKKEGCGIKDYVFYMSKYIKINKCVYIYIVSFAHHLHMYLYHISICRMDILVYLYVLTISLSWAVPEHYNSGVGEG